MTIPERPIPAGRKESQPSWRRAEFPNQIAVVSTWTSSSCRIPSESIAHVLLAIAKLGPM
jgi:hypothetical protein